MDALQDAWQASKLKQKQTGFGLDTSSSNEQPGSSDRRLLDGANQATQCNTQQSICDETIGNEPFGTSRCNMVGDSVTRIQETIIDETTIRPRQDEPPGRFFASNDLHGSGNRTVKAEACELQRPNEAVKDRPKPSASPAPDRMINGASGGDDKPLSGQNAAPNGTFSADRAGQAATAGDDRENSPSELVENHSSSIRTRSSMERSGSEQATQQSDTGNQMDPKSQPEDGYETRSDCAGQSQNSRDDDKISAIESTGRSQQRSQTNRVIKQNPLVENGNERAEIGRNQIRAPALIAAVKAERPSLIRRDDSWQSLVSLTRAGAVAADTSQQVVGPTFGTTAMMLEPGKSERAQAQFDQAIQNLNNMERRRLINIESTVTPLRGPASLLRRQLSVQVTRPSWQNQRQQQLSAQSNSFDVQQTSSQFQQQQQLVHSQQNSVLASYHQKLLQLQMSQNGSNVDYVRQTNDHQIYAPESIATNHYGYYSMRSNLKSAASEFSFVRPESSVIPAMRVSTQLQQQRAQELADEISGMPQQYSSYALDSHSTNLGHQMIHIDSKNNRLSLVPMSPNMTNGGQVNMNQINNAEFSTPMNQRRVVLSELPAPSRELPSKPNKKRASKKDAGDAAKTSMASNITGFFRRAFSRRSKRRSKTGKLDGSHSSSLGAFDEGNFHGGIVIQSAFSTGSKSVNQQQSRPAEMPPQKMIDMIEAFRNKTILDQSYRQQNALGLNGSENLVGSKQQLQQQGIDPTHQLPPHLSAYQQLQQQQQQPRGLISNDAQNLAHLRHNQFSEQLNKSSSISATMGMADVVFGSPLAAGRACANGISASPYAEQRRHPKMPVVSQLETDTPVASARSPRVMSANLTPLFARPDLQQASLDSLQLGLSPRGAMGYHRSSGDPLPRPSSIYGQPSMITSSATSSQVDRLANTMLHHRNSLYMGRDSCYETRARYSIALPTHLDTTREVLEEVCTPTESTANFEEKFEQAERAFRQPQSPAAFYQRHAAMNPMLHSSTMDAIYDNHPLVQQADSTVIDSVQAHSHYDNQPATTGDSIVQHNGFRSSSEHHAMAGQSVRLSELAFRNQQHRQQQQQALQARQREQLAHYPNGLPNGVPARPHSNRSANDAYNAQGSDARAMAPNMPGAMAGLRTPSRGMLNNRTPIKDLPVHQPSSLEQSHNMAPMLHEDRRSFAGVCPSHSYAVRASNDALASASPVAARRGVYSQSAQAGVYQYSPLVDRQTRLLKRNDGTQATILGPVRGESDYAQPVIDHSKYIGSNPGSSSSSACIDTFASYSDNLIRGEQTNLIPSHQKREMGTLDHLEFNSTNRSGLSSSAIDDSSTNPSHNSRTGCTPTSRSDRSNSYRGSTSTESSTSGSVKVKQSKNSSDKVSASELDNTSERSARKQYKSKAGTKKGGVRNFSTLSSNNGDRSLSLEHSEDAGSPNGNIEEPDDDKWIVSKLID